MWRRGDVLAEIDTAGDPACCFGIVGDLRVVAERVVAAIRQRDRAAAARSEAGAISADCAIA